MLSKFYQVNLQEGRPRRRWEDNIRMGLKEIGRGIGLIRLKIGIIGELL